MSPRTFARWLSAEKKTDAQPRKVGRPRTPEETRQIVIRLEKENDWGFTRLWGELKKLGIKIGKTTLRNILKENGIDPGPERMTGGTWDEFVKRHVATLAQGGVNTTPGGMTAASRDRESQAGPGAGAARQGG